MVVQFVHGGLFCSRLCCCLKCWDGGLGVGLEGRGRKRAKRRTRTKKCARIKKGVSMCAWKSDGTLGSKRALAASWMATRDCFDLSVKRKKKAPPIESALHLFTSAFKHETGRETIEDTKSKRKAWRIRTGQNSVCTADCQRTSASLPDSMSRYFHSLFRCRRTLLASTQSHSPGSVLTTTHSYCSTSI